jgi:hypothetical protein
MNFVEPFDPVECAEAEHDPFVVVFGKPPPGCVSSRSMYRRQGRRPAR